MQQSRSGIQCCRCINAGDDTKSSCRFRTPGIECGRSDDARNQFQFFSGTAVCLCCTDVVFGAALGAGIVYGIGSMSRNGLTPLRLVLAGAAVTALLFTLSEGIALYFNVGQDMAFWYAGGVSSTRWSHLAIITPIVIIMLFIAMRISKSITILSLGEEVAVSLGNTVRTKLISAGVIVVLAGLAVSVVGAVSFVGLIVPHLTRRLVGYDYRWIIPVSAVVGAILVVVADLFARTLNAPFEIPIGALYISLIGVPFFLYLARKEVRQYESV